MKSGTVLPFFLALLMFAQCAKARQCQYETGEKRWSVKTSVPGPADATNAQRIELKSLIDLENPDLTADQVHEIENKLWTEDVEVKDSSGRKIKIHEGDIISVSGYVYRVRCQSDGDYHLEIGFGKTRKSSCLIVEVPDPDEITDRRLKALINDVRAKLEELDPSVFQSHPTKAPLKITVTGQLFLDAPHLRANDPSGGRGTLLLSRRHCASNLWEIHPVIEIQ